MRVTIQGLTDATIQFNTTGIALRGKEIARNIDIVNQKQTDELSELMKLGIISVFNEPDEDPDEESLLAFNTPKAVVEETVEEVEPKVSKPKKGRKGRPKGAKDKKPRKRTPVKQDDEEEVEIDEVAKAAAAAAKSIEASETETKVVIGTDDGAIKTSTRNKASGEIEESAATKPSIDAMKKLEAEEAREKAREAGEVVDEEEDVPVINEEDLDPSERMGLNATMITGDGVKTEPMVHSILPEPNFINPDPLSDSIKTKQASKSEDKEDGYDPFLDDEENDIKDDADKQKEPFIEI